MLAKLASLVLPIKLKEWQLYTATLSINHGKVQFFPGNDRFASYC
jgi:hypothetical protein